MLKIIGGEFKNRQIKTPKGDQTRPTSSLVRKAIFDICQNEIEGAHFLDLYAGSGAMGIEALSRGAASATFVENNRFAVQCIQENLRELKLEGTIIRIDALKAVPQLAKDVKRFDIIYIDPPYSQETAPLLLKIEEEKLLKSGGRLFVEQRTTSELNLNVFKLESSRKFGDTQILIFTFT